jgi:hypothetical protein
MEIEEVKGEKPEELERTSELEFSNQYSFIYTQSRINFKNKSYFRLNPCRGYHTIN